MDKARRAYVSDEQATKGDVQNVVTGVENVINKASDEIIDAFKDEMNKFSENHGLQEVNTNVEKLANGQNAVLEAVDGMVNYMKDEVTAANENAKKHAHISHQVRGQLGAEVRKQRKEDADEIERLRDMNDRMLKYYFLETLRNNSVLVAKVTDMQSKMTDMQAKILTELADIKSLLTANKKPRK